MKKELLQVADETQDKCFYTAYERKNGTQLSKKSDETNVGRYQDRKMEEREESCYHLPDFARTVANVVGERNYHGHEQYDSIENPRIVLQVII